MIYSASPTAHVAVPGGKVLVLIISHFLFDLFVFPFIPVHSFSLVLFGVPSGQDLGGAVWLRGEKFQAQVLVLEPQRPINDNGPQLHSAPGA